MLGAVGPERSMAVTWTKTSGPSLSGWMKPNPLVELNHFTVPFAIVTDLFSLTSESPFKMLQKRLKSIQDRTAMHLTSNIPYNHYAQGVKSGELGLSLNQLISVFSER